MRLLRSWWGIKGGLSSSRGSRERHGGQIPEIQKTARIETGKWLNEVGVGVREGHYYDLRVPYSSKQKWSWPGPGIQGYMGSENWGLGGGWGVTILALKQQMKWAPTLCPIPALRSLVTKIETANSYVYFDNLVWKKIIFFYKTLPSEIDNLKHEKGHLCCG